MSNYAVVENGTVTNVVVWDGKSEWKPVAGDVIPATEGVGIGWSYSDGAFTAPVVPESVKSHDELVADAEAEKSARLDEAKSKIVVWQTKLLMGRTLTPDETSSLNIWMDYIDAVTAVDTSTAPDIVWPTVPE
ncbi:tail fiber assembly protein [Kluyvera sp. M-M157-B]|uniref:tail fiber assembly protein n=1 Tax=Kluyvera sp. M-M157-B TaxID=3402291 RepID=UPI003B439ECF